MPGVSDKSIWISLGSTEKNLPLINWNIVTSFVDISVSNVEILMLKVQIAVTSKPPEL